MTPAAPPSGAPDRTIDDDYLTPRSMWVTWVLSVLVVAALVASLILDLVNGLGTSQENWDGPLVVAGLALSTIAFSTVGMLISFKRPGNRVGWLSLAIALALAITGLAGSLKEALYATKDPLSGGVVVAWFDNWFWTIPIGLLGTFFVLLFPDGRLPSRRWAPVAWLSAVGILLGCGIGALEPGPLSDAPELVNPYGLEGADWLLTLLAFGYALIPLCFLASAIAMFTRYRRAHGDERQQLKWFVLATTPHGSGLRNMADRVAAAGGALEVTSTPGQGTTVSGRVPVRALEAA